MPKFGMPVDGDKTPQYPPVFHRRRSVNRFSGHSPDGYAARRGITIGLVMIKPSGPPDQSLKPR